LKNQRATGAAESREIDFAAQRCGFGEEFIWL